ncbi:MAG TPA: PEP-CTERM sorting domain-containing protein [Gemmataceae bacterium]|nr:PEP-CTERM sorting domain-containing protein [Gemmataceae bacterium]
MSEFQSWRWSALAVALGLSVTAAQAEMITPESIPNPPSAVGSANGTPISMNNIVISQYAGLGMNFNGPAITSLNGVPVWVAVNFPAGVNVGPTVDYANSLGQYVSVGGSFVVPGTSQPLSPSSVTFDLIGNPGTPKFNVGGYNGMPLSITPVLQSTPGADGGQLWTVTGTGIYSVYVSSTANNSPWGVSEVSFTTASAPEPSSLVLAGLGALGLATRFGWRRVRTAT